MSLKPQCWVKMLLVYSLCSSTIPDHQATYMITFNPAVRSCLPSPIVNLWWILWLSLKFASHFIFWRSTPHLQFVYQRSSESNVNNKEETLASLSRQFSQQLYPACTEHSSWTEEQQGSEHEISWLEDTSSFSLSFGAFRFWRWLCNGRAYATAFRYIRTVLCCDCLTISAENLAPIRIKI